MRAQTSRKNLVVAAALLAGSLWTPQHPSASVAEGPARSSEDSRRAARLPFAAGSGLALPSGFEPNQGQTDPQVRFLSRGRGYALFLTGTEAIVSLRQASERGRRPVMLRMQPAGANPAPRVMGEMPLAGKAGYFRGKDLEDVLAGVPTYGRVRYEDLYPDVDLVFYDNGRHLEYDFIVAAGADPGVIRLTFTGADKLSVNAAGELVLHTEAGELRQPAPVIYQETNGVRSAVPGGYLLEGPNRIRFRVGDYDRTRPLVIDPVLAYSTYLGGAADEVGWDIAVDSAGNAYVSGARPSVRAPDAYDYDAYVAKFSAAGVLLWVTDLGDNCDDEARGVALDGAGNVYATGQLGNCYPFPTLNPGAFVAKLNAAGAGTYMFPFSDYWYGGADLGQAVAVDSGGRAYVTGITTSDQFPATPGAYQEAFAGGIGDGFVVKVNAGGSALLFATYLGGTAYESANDIALDAGGNAYVVGSTESQDFPTRNAYQPVHPGWGPGDQAGFVTKIRPDGSDLVYSTYLGGGPMDIAQGVAVDSLGNAYVAGVTQSSEFPITPGVVQPAPGDNRWCFYTICTDAFVTKFNASGSALLYSTYLGGNIFDEASGIAIDNAGNAYVTGNTLSFDFPTFDAFQPNPAGDLEAFVTKLNPAGSAFVYSSYLGGSKVSTAVFEGEDTGIRIAVQPGSDSAYVVGVTRSPDFPVLNAHQPTFGGGVCGYTDYRCSDAFVTRIGWGCTFAITPITQAFAASGGAGTVSVTASSNTCGWTAASAAPWITITSGTTGTGSGPVGYAVAANTGTTPRTGTVNIAGHAFTVTQSAATAASVTVTAPNGGERVYTGTAYVIAWTATGATGFDVAASVDGGATYAPVPGCAGLAAEARSCTWTAPGPATTTARIRVTAHGNGGSLADVSNSAFSILSGTAVLSLTFPDKAVNVGIGSTQLIKWSHNLGTKSFVRIELSRDGGVTFPETLVALHPNAKASSGSFTWTVAGPATAGPQARIRISWTNGAASDTSGASFIIAPVFIKLAAPAGGSTWAFDTTQTQKWTTNLGALDKVNVQLSATGIDGTFSTMSGGANVIATRRQAKVLVPAVPTATARVRVVWANPPAGFAAAGINPGNFTIAPPS